MSKRLSASTLSSLATDSHGSPQPLSDVNNIMFVLRHPAAGDISQLRPSIINLCDTIAEVWLMLKWSDWQGLVDFCLHWILDRCDIVTAFRPSCLTSSPSLSLCFSLSFFPSPFLINFFKTMFKNNSIKDSWEVCLSHLHIHHVQKTSTKKAKYCQVLLPSDMQLPSLPSGLPSATCLESFSASGFSSLPSEAADALVLTWKQINKSAGTHWKLLSLIQWVIYLYRHPSRPSSPPPAPHFVSWVSFHSRYTLVASYQATNIYFRIRSPLKEVSFSVSAEHVGAWTRRKCVWPLFFPAPHSPQTPGAWNATHLPFPRRCLVCCELSWVRPSTNTAGPSLPMWYQPRGFVLQMSRQRQT